MVVIPLTTDGPGMAVRLHVTAAQTGVAPATLVATPSFARPGEPVALEAKSVKPAASWQWDYDGDGTFDEEAAGSVYHAYDEGRYAVIARTRIDGRWVYAVAPLAEFGDPPITHSTNQVGEPRAITMVSARLATADDELVGTRHVLVADGDRVEVFDAKLALLRTLTGLSHPAGAAEDAAGRFYVADTGANRVVRFLPDGTVDATFADARSFRGAGTPLTAPAAVAAFEDSVSRSRRRGCRADCSATTCRDAKPALSGNAQPVSLLAIPAHASAWRDGRLWIARFGDVLASAIRNDSAAVMDIPMKNGG